MERLDKILSNLGYGSRKDIKKIIKEGRVQVNKETIRDNSFKINPYKDKIELDGEEIQYRKYIYIMMNKPKGLVSSTYDPANRTVLDLIDSKYLAFSPFPVGRLDKDTEGLLILSNDGKLAHELLSPKKGIEKTYYVEVEGFIDQKYKSKFCQGIVLDDGYKTLPAKLEILEQGFFSKAQLTIMEGKFHQVKRMFQAIGMEVVYLKRISMGGLKLDESLGPGEYRELTEEEIQLLKEEKSNI
ncbi:MAG: rRNA pseudouridine synthase [Tissierellia bacterium]|nr:rRNA pseudouridine synthase [Tissierellia bacterium]